MSRKIVLACVIGFLLWAGVGVGLWFWMCAKQDAKKLADLAQDVNVEAVMQRVELSRGAEGKAEWRLTADGADYLREQALVRLTNPKITYYRPDGSEVLVSASEGEVSQETGDAALWPDVLIVSGPNTIHSKRLDYAGKKREIELTDQVRLDRGDLTLRAPRLTMLLSSNDITAGGGVTSTLWPAQAPAKEPKK
ncbi:LPS export ABC transporter periplasmic protein LptC [Desulfocurvus sp. DL9XJH121]